MNHATVTDTPLSCKNGTISPVHTNTSQETQKTATVHSSVIVHKMALRAGHRFGIQSHHMTTERMSISSNSSAINSRINRQCYNRSRKQQRQPSQVQMEPWINLGAATSDAHDFQTNVLAQSPTIPNKKSRDESSKSIEITF